MVDAGSFKREIEEILVQDYKIEFLGKNFDKIVSFLTEKKAETIISWIKGVIEENFQPISIGSKKSYKSWKMNELLVFRYPFIVKNTEYRVLIVKVKNSFYIEFHMGDHKYYDKTMKELDLKK